MPFFTRPGLRMYFEVHPGAVASDTLLIHGNCASHLWWEPAREAWYAIGAGRLPGCLIVADWRGCGNTSAPADAEALAMHSLAADYVALLRELGVARANVVGHSTGGLLAMLAMSQAPELFSRAVLLDPILPQRLALDETLLSRMERMGEDREFAAAVMAGTIHGVDVGSPYFSRVVDTAFGMHPLNRRGVLRALASSAMDGDYRAQARGLRHPILVMHGELDAVLPWEPSREFVPSLREGRFALLDGQGHSCNVENPRRFVTLADHFLTG